MFNITIIMVALAAGEPSSSVRLPVTVNYLPSRDVHRHSTPASEHTRVNEGRQGQPQLASYLAAMLIAQSQERSGRTKVIHETQALIESAHLRGLVHLGSEGLNSHSALENSMGRAGTGFSESSAEVSNEDAAGLTVFAGGVGAASASMLPSLAEVQSAAITAAGGGIPSKPGQASKLKTPAQTHRAVRSYSPSGKVSANVSDMSPRAKRLADYLATLPPPNNATLVNGDEVNADRLPQPWPEPIDCGRYWNESHPSCSVYSDPWGFDALLPVGRAAPLLNRNSMARGVRAPFARNIEGSGDAIHVTSHGVALPSGPKYSIPKRFVQNPRRPASYGVLDEGTGKFVEKLRIDPATPRGKPGPEFSHYHLNGEKTHYRPGFDDPGFPQ